MDRFRVDWVLVRNWRDNPDNRISSIPQVFPTLGEALGAALQAGPRALDGRFQ
jgi:hypothetical protein